MKSLFSFFLFGMITAISAQTVPNLPIPMGAGTAEVWNDSLYFFGGANTWSGRDQRYNRVYKFNGMSWTYQDSIPDDNVWDVESVLVGNEVYLVGGWPSGASLLRKTDLSDGTWTYLRPSPNATTWGITAEYLRGHIYLFNDRVHVFEYDIANDAWAAKTPNPGPAYLGLSSVVWQDEIYILGFYNSGFYKYFPAADEWTQLADTPYPVAACAMGILNDMIYCVGGSEQGSPSEAYRTVLAYDIGTDSWAVDHLQISGKRTWMAAAEYQGEFYIIGGIDSTGNAVDVVEEIIPLGPVSVGRAESLPSEFSLSQNYPNPFNPETTITYALPERLEVKINITNALGQSVRTFEQGLQEAGQYRLHWNGKDNTGAQVGSGVYYYQMNAGLFRQAHKMLLLR